MPYAKDKLTKKQLKNLSSIRFWGAGISAHQAEGNTTNQWSKWELENAKSLAAKSKDEFGSWLPIWDSIKDTAQDPKTYISGSAANHYELYEQDFDKLTDMNCNAYRFSIEWSRIEPQEGEWDDSQIEHYRHYIRSLRQRGIEPVVTFWHWTVPVWFEEAGGFAKRKNVVFFERFCQKIIEELGTEFTYVCILNEPNVYTSMSILSRRWPPQQGSLLHAVFVMFNLVKAHKVVAKRLVHSHTVGIAYAVSASIPLRKDPITVIVKTVFDYMWNIWFLARIKNHVDFIGINFYFTTYWKGFKEVKVHEDRSDYGWHMNPRSISKAIERIDHAFNKPIMITENGVADASDQYRQWWINETMLGLSDAIDSGAQIIGYMHWSLLDNFEWAEGYWPRFGLIEVDFVTQERTVRKSGRYYGRQIAKIRDSS